MLRGSVYAAIISTLVAMPASGIDAAARFKMATEASAKTSAVIGLVSHLGKTNFTDDAAVWKARLGHAKALLDAVVAAKGPVGVSITYPSDVTHKLNRYTKIARSIKTSVSA